MEGRAAGSSIERVGKDQIPSRPRPRHTLTSHGAMQRRARARRRKKSARASSLAKPSPKSLCAKHRQRKSQSARHSRKRRCQNLCALCVSVARIAPLPLCGQNPSTRVRASRDRLSEQSRAPGRARRVANPLGVLDPRCTRWHAEQSRAPAPSPRLPNDLFIKNPWPLALWPPRCTRPRWQCLQSEQSPFPRCPTP